MKFKKAVRRLMAKGGHIWRAKYPEHAFVLGGPDKDHDNQQFLEPEDSAVTDPSFSTDDLFAEDWKHECGD